MTTSPSRRSHPRPWLVAATVSAAMLVPVGTAAARTWHTSQRTLVQFLDVCRDGFRFGGAVREGAEPAGPYTSLAVAVQPPPSSWTEWKDKKGEVMNTPIVIPEFKDTLITEEEGAVEVSHKGELTKQHYRNRPLKLGPVALNLENGRHGSNLNTAEVTDCFLYAPIDVEPGKSANKVPIGHGQVSVAALATKIMPADGLTPSDFRFGPGQASAIGSKLRDVNGDNRTDLVLHFSSVAAGLECSTKTVLLKGKAPKGGTYEGTDKIAPSGC